MKAKTGGLIVGDTQKFGLVNGGFYIDAECILLLYELAKMDEPLCCPATAREYLYNTQLVPDSMIPSFETVRFQDR